jgi:hypothetical protein
MRGELRQHELLGAGVDVALHLLLDIIDGADQQRPSGDVFADASGHRHPLKHALLEGRVVVQEERHLDCAANRRRVSTYVATVLIEHGELVRDFLRRPPNVRSVGVLSDGQQRALLAPTTDQDRRVRLLDVRRVVGRLVQLVVAALEVGLRLRPEQLDHLHGFVQPLQSLARRVEGDCEDVVLVRMPGSADAELQPAAGDVIDRRRLLGQDRRVSVGVAANEDAKPHARGRLSEGGEARPALHAWPF